jgi:hypothetical protein
MELVFYDKTIIPLTDKLFQLIFEGSFKAGYTRKLKRQPRRSMGEWRYV